LSVSERRSAPAPDLGDASDSAQQLEPSAPQPLLDSDPTAAELIRGQFRLVRRLGGGSQGSTYLAIDRSRNAQVAIKRFDLRTSTDWKQVELFERECRVLRSLRHEAIPRYLEHFEHDGAYYLVMDRVVGESLQERRARGQRMSEPEIWRLLFELGAVLDWLHGGQPAVIHRDIKPSNLIRRPDGSLAIVDFGAVRDVLRVQGGSTVAGTFGYMAPEQMQGRALPQTDVYGLGATAVALMSGLEPEQFPHKGLRIDLTPLVASDSLKAVLALMLEPDPDLRPRSVRDALGSHMPDAAAKQQYGAPDAPKGATAQQNRPAGVEGSALDALARSVPAVVSLALALLLWVAGLALFVLSRAVLPLLALLVRSVAGDGAGNRLRALLSGAQSVERKLFASSGHLAHCSLSAAGQRREKSLQLRSEARMRARERRARLRDEAKCARRKMRERNRAARRDRGAGGWL
jgi:hypothetical protein